MLIPVTLQIGHDATDPTSDPKDCTLDLSDHIIGLLERGFKTIKVIEKSRDSIIVETHVYVEDPSQFRVED